MVEALTTACARFNTPAPEIQWYLVNDSRTSKTAACKLASIRCRGQVVPGQDNKGSVKTLAVLSDILLFFQVEQAVQAPGRSQFKEP